MTDQQADVLGQERLYGCIWLEARLDQGVQGVRLNAQDLGSVLRVFAEERDVPRVEPEGRASRDSDQVLKTRGSRPPQIANRAVGEPAAGRCEVVRVERGALQALGESDPRRGHAGR